MLASSQMATVISAYAPTLDAQEDVKEAFYADLDTILSEVPKEDKLILLGDFNARVGLGRGTLGSDGVGNTIFNGLLLLTKCSEYNLAITNTIFHQKTPALKNGISLPSPSLRSKDGLSLMKDREEITHRWRPWSNSLNCPSLREWENHPVWKRCRTLSGQ